MPPGGQPGVSDTRSQMAQPSCAGARVWIAIAAVATPQVSFPPACRAHRCRARAAVAGVVFVLDGAHRRGRPALPGHAPHRPGGLRTVTSCGPRRAVALWWHTALAVEVLSLTLRARGSGGSSLMRYAVTARLCGSASGQVAEPCPRGRAGPRRSGAVSVRARWRPGSIRICVRTNQVHLAADQVARLTRAIDDLAAASPASLTASRAHRAGRQRLDSGQ